jgi:CubicO group peptidase (beta-lactamase class C family)
VAVVKDGQIIFAKGYGIRAVGASEPVDEHTPFYIASATKTFTLAAIGLLADSGKLRLDDPVTKYLPTFALGDETSRLLTVRDLVSHRTGYPRADLLMFAGLDADAILGRMAKLAPVAPIRARFTYQNQMYLALSQIVSKVSGQTYADFVSSRLLAPLQMTDSNATGLAAVARGARPHASLNGAIRPIDIIARAPCGGGAVNSSARDLGRWLQCIQSDGTWQGTKLVSPQVLQAPLQPNSIVQRTVWSPDANVLLYGLGWFLSDYHGKRVAQHGGNGEGWTSLLWILPDRKLGIAVVTNMNNSLLPWAIAHGVADAYLGEPARDWNAHFQVAERARDAANARFAPIASSAALNAVDWSGVWSHPVYGDVTITADGSIELRYGPSMTGILSAAEGGAAVTWQRTDLRAVIGQSAARLVDRNGIRTLQLVFGGDTIEFSRARSGDALRG